MDYKVEVILWTFGLCFLIMAILVALTECFCSPRHATTVGLVTDKDDDAQTKARAPPNKRQNSGSLSINKTKRQDSYDPSNPKDIRPASTPTLDEDEMLNNSDKNSAEDPLIASTSKSKTGRRTPEELYEVVTIPKTVPGGKLAPLAPLTSLGASGIRPLGSVSSPLGSAPIGSQVPATRRMVIDTVTTVLGELEAAGRASIDEDELLEMFMQKGCEESHTCELINCVEPPVFSDKDQITLFQLTTAKNAYRIQLARLASQLQVLINDSSAEHDETFEDMTKPVDGRTEEAQAMADVRTLNLFVDMTFELDGTTDKQKEALRKISRVAMQKSQLQMDAILASFNKLQGEFTELVEQPACAKQLRGMWKDLDSNGSKKVPTVEINSFFRRKYPLLSQPRANKEAFKSACGEDGFVNRMEFVTLIRDVVFFNKVYFLFAMADTSNDRKVRPSEFAGFLKVVAINLSKEEQAAEFARADQSGNGVIKFTEFVEWLSNYTIAYESLKKIYDDEEL